jgi:hypothetical protein
MADAFSGYCEGLAAMCAAVDLATELLCNPSQVRVWRPDLECYAELVSCRRLRGSEVFFLCSWGDPITPATEPQKAATASAGVVSPSRVDRQVPAHRGRR